MRTPFIYQTTFYDCIPVTFINALTFLFDREEIPGNVISSIYRYSMDKMHCKGTTRYAVQLIAHWITSYRTPEFKVEYEFLTENEVNLSKGNDIEECFYEEGVVLCRLQVRHWHYALALRSDSKRIYFFDPYLRARKIQGCDGNVQLLDTDGYGPNLSISKKWLDQRNPGKRKFCFGRMGERETVLLWRV